MSLFSYSYLPNAILKYEPPGKSGLKTSAEGHFVTRCWPVAESQDSLCKKSTPAKQIFTQNGLFLPNRTGLQNHNQNKKENPGITGLHPFLCEYFAQN